MKPWKLKRNTYMILPEAGNWSLFVCLGIRKSKLFDYGIGYRQSNNTIKWKGMYGKTAYGWEGLVQRCHELHALDIKRDYAAEKKHGYEE